MASTISMGAPSPTPIPAQLSNNPALSTTKPGLTTTIQIEEINSPITTTLTEEKFKENLFLNLPAELRNTIYILLLASQLTPSHRRLLAANHCSSYVLSIPPLYPGILTTCRQINNEATPILYNNTFTASATLLTSLPFLVHPTRPISCPGVSSRIKKWYINVRLDCDAQFTESQATKAFSGAEELEIEARQAMFRAADNGVLMLFQKVRNVGRAIVHGSVDSDVAEWLQDVMTLPEGEEVDAFVGAKRKSLTGVEEEYDAWSHGNR